MRPNWAQWFLVFKDRGRFFRRRLGLVIADHLRKHQMLMLPLWAGNGDLGGHHLGGDLINPLYIHIYFILRSYNTILVLDSNRLENYLLSRSRSDDLDHALRVCWVRIVSPIDPGCLYR